MNLNILLLLGVFLPQVLSSVIPYENEHIRSYAEKVLSEYFTADSNPVEAVMDFITVERENGRCSGSDALTLVSHIAPKIYEHRKQLEHMQKFAEFVVKMIVQDGIASGKLELLQIITFESEVMDIDTRAVIYSMYTLLYADDIDAYLDSLVENFEPEMFRLPLEIIYRHPAARFTDFLLKYLDTLVHKWKGDRESICQFDTALLVAVFNVNERIGGNFDLESRAIAILLGLRSMAIPASIQSQFLKLLSKWVTTCLQSFEEALGRYFEKFDVNSLRPEDYENYATIARFYKGCPMNDHIRKIVSTRQRYIDEFFEALDQIKFDPAVQSIKDIVEVEKSMRSLLNKKYGLEYISNNEFIRITDTFANPILKQCAKSYGELKDPFVLRIKLSILLLHTRIHPVETYPVHFAVALLTTIDCVSTVKGLEVFQQAAKTIAPKTIEVLLKHGSSIKFEYSTFVNMMVYTRDYAPEMLPRVAVYLLERPDISSTIPRFIMDILSDCDLIDGSYIIYGLMARFKLLSDGIQVRANSAIVLELFGLATYAKCLTDSQKKVIKLLGKKFMDPAYYNQMIKWRFL